MTETKSKRIIEVPLPNLCFPRTRWTENFTNFLQRKPILDQIVKFFAQRDDRLRLNFFIPTVERGFCEHSSATETGHSIVD